MRWVTAISLETFAQTQIARTELSVTYRGTFGPIELDVDTPTGCATCCPTSRRARVAAGGCASCYGCTTSTTLACGPIVRPQAVAVDEQKRIDGALETAAKEACSIEGDSFTHVALQAASLMAVKLRSYHECKRAPAVLLALLKSPARRRVDDPARMSQSIQNTRPLRSQWP